ncbi:unnamed protein product [Taenia asiatica]|uniref:C2H2-type domain-containing protein n=1 Tax=Taenia asiatica TaxID=60517 RepID=A0A158R8W4_TAEAS|nr:unnamed protein product [Taenia asiatica]
MTSAVSTVSAFQSPAEAKANPQFGGPSAPDLDQPQSSNNFFQPYQSPPFNPFVYLSYTTPSSSNANPVTTSAQQTFNSASVNQHRQSKSSASFALLRILVHTTLHFIDVESVARSSECDVAWLLIFEDTPANDPSLALSVDARFPMLAISKGIATFTAQSLDSIALSVASPSDRLLVCPLIDDSTVLELRAEYAFSVGHRADAEAVVAVAVGSINSNTVSSSGEGAKDAQQQEALSLSAASEAEQLSSENRQQSTCNNEQDAESCYRGVAMAAAAAFRRNFVHADSPTIGSTGATTSAVSRPPDRWRKAHVRKQVKVDENAIPTLEGITTDQLKLVAAAVAVGGSSASDGPPGSALDAKGRAFNFPCPACPRRFVFQCRLAAHLRSHTNFRPFTCPDCGRAFTQRGYLVRHAAVHANERPFVCTLCDRAYKHYGSLVNHRRTHSKSSGAGTSSTSSKPRSRLGTSSSAPSGYRCVPTMAPLAAPALPMWASAGVPFAASASTYHSSAISQQQQHQSIFLRTPFSYLPTPQ